MIRHYSPSLRQIPGQMIPVYCD